MSQSIARPAEAAETTLSPGLDGFAKAIAFVLCSPFLAWNWLAEKLFGAVLPARPIPDLPGCMFVGTQSCARPRKGRVCVARFHQYLDPADRGGRYEEPLAELLGSRGLGKLLGGGTMMDAGSNIVFADLEFLVHDHQALADVRKVLEDAGAPAGTELLFEDQGVERALPIGTHAMVHVQLAPQAGAYERFVAWLPELKAAAGSVGGRLQTGMYPEEADPIAAQAQRDQETAALLETVPAAARAAAAEQLRAIAEARAKAQAETGMQHVDDRSELHFYGPDAERLFQAVAPLVGTHPLGAGATATVYARHPAKPARKVAL